MNKYIYSIIALLMIMLCPAQMFVSQAEYFWDNDPGAGNGTAVLASDGNFNSAFEQLTKTGVTTPGSGLHKLCIRIKDNTGVWGPVFTNVINVQQNQTSAPMAIAQAEYFWDNDPGAGNGTPVLAADGNFNSSFEQLTKTGIALPTGGLHVFNIRVKDNTGVWGPVFRNVVGVQNQASTGCWQTLSAGTDHSAGIKTDGTLWAWGSNYYGQLGDGTTVTTNIPIQIGTANDWVKIFAGNHYTFGIKTDGTLWAWGVNDYGQLGDGTKTDKLIPTQIGTATNWRSITTGWSHTVALKTDGTLWSWGYNVYGQLGNGTLADNSVPTKIGTATNWQSVEAGQYHNVAVKTDGTLWEWGNNIFGQPGNTSVAKTSPVQIGTATDWKGVSVGDYHSIAMKNNGTLWGWGLNDAGQLGDGTTVSKYTPTQIGTGTNWLSTSAGAASTYANKTDGTLWSWGSNYYGQLGIGTSGNVPALSPVQVGSSSDNVLISAGNVHALALNVDGFLKAGGQNVSGQLGDGTFVQRNIFTPIACPSNCAPTTQFSTTNITSSTATISWAASGSAPIGGYLYFYSTNPLVGGIDGTTVSPTKNLTNLLPNTKYYWWVASQCGSSRGNWTLGGTFTTLPTALTGCWQKVSSGYIHSVGLKTDGTLWAWGNNSYGQLGIGSAGSKSTPTQIGTANDWQKIATGNYHSIALKTNGTIWTWGRNDYGQIGDGTSVDRTTPVQLGNATDWVSVASGDNYIMALKSNGTLWAWGSNLRGQLGDGTTVNKSFPIQIGTATNWQTIAPASQHTLAIKTDGTLWGWGYNTSGQLGSGTSTISNPVPAQIGTATNWKSVAGGVSHSLGVKTDGTLWTWGDNYYGQLGSGILSNSYTPAQIGTATDWRSVAANYDYSSFAIKTDNTLWAWGKNDSGQLGEGTGINRKIPTLIGSATDRQSVAANVDNTLVINASGFLSSCGSNMYGQLGDNTSISKKIFIPVACPTSSLAVNETTSAAPDHLKVFPNPVQDILNITYGQKILSVTVYSAAGQLVTTKIINDTRGTVDFSALTSGVYLVNVHTDNNTVKTIKVIKR